MDSPFAARLPFEVLDGVRHVGRCTVDPRLDECVVEHAAGRPDERPAGSVLLVARLLAHEHDRRLPRALAEHGLRAELPQVTAAAAGRRLPQLRQRLVVRQEIGG